MPDVYPIRPRWGIVGPGRIAHDFAAALKLYGSTISAVAAGSLPDALERAEAFAAKFGIPHAYGTYEELAKDDTVDVVYVSTTNQLHLNNTLLLLSHGKHVLVEKPTGLTADEAQQMIQLAKQNNLLLVTNFWTRFFPAVKYAQEVVRSGVLGNFTSMRGDFSFQTTVDVGLHNRFLDRDVGGGAMYDMGCYLIQFAVLLTDALPNTIQAVGVIDPKHRVDVEADFHLTFKDVTARFSTSLRRPSEFDVAIYGTHGQLTIVPPSNCPTEVEVEVYADALPQHSTPIPCCGQPLVSRKQFSSPLPEYPPQYQPGAYPRGEGFVYVIAAVEKCFSEACTEIPEMTYDHQLKVMQIQDVVLTRIGYF